MSEREAYSIHDPFDALDDAILSIASELELGAVFQRITDFARELVGTRYCAIGIVGPDGYLSDFITSGLSTTERERLGTPPRGHGILGVLMREQRTLRFADLGQDPRSVGFPPHHPPMVSFLGVPIRVGDQAVGNLYLTEKIGTEEFSAADERLAERLARHAAIAVLNARRFTAMETQRQQLQAIIECLPQAATIRDVPSGRLRAANTWAHALLGIATLAEGGLAEVAPDFHPHHPDGTAFPVEATPTVRALTTGSTSVDEEMVIIGPDNRPMHLVVSAIPVRDPVGHVTAVVSLFRDVTQAREAEQLKDDFLSLVSHELRTPLTTIQGAAHMLLAQGDELTPMAREMLRLDIASESERLSRMLKNMLALSAYQAGRLHIEHDPFLLQPLLRGVVREAERHYPAYHFVLDLLPGLPPVEGDEELIAQVVRNLVENAAKYTPANSTITLGARTSANAVIVSVRDEGPGIAPEEQQRIFQRFHRASTGRQGMGLGLYLCQRLVEAHGGLIWVESAVGAGAAFRFTLPQVPEGEADEEADDPRR